MPVRAVSLMRSVRFYEKDGFKFKKENDFPFVETADQE